MKIASRFTSSFLALALLAPVVQAGSLWRDGPTDQRGMFADKRASRIGDILTIVIKETAGMSNKLELSTAKKSTAGAEGAVSNLVNQFLVNIPSLLLGREMNKIADSNSFVLPSLPTLPVSGQNDYSGSGSIDNQQTINGKASVTVIDVLPNGNLVVEGVREISYSDEKQYVSLHGVVRPYDIEPDNTVSSSLVADAQIMVVSDGTLTEAQRKGWLLRLNDKINPF